MALSLPALFSINPSLSQTLLNCSGRHPHTHAHAHTHPFSSLFRSHSCLFPQAIFFVPLLLIVNILTTNVHLLEVTHTLVSKDVFHSQQWLFGTGMTINHKGRFLDSTSSPRFTCGILTTIITYNVTGLVLCLSPRTRGFPGVHFKSPKVTNENER